VAQDLRAHGILGASYIRRTPGYPLLLLASSNAVGTTLPARWVGPVLAAGAAFAIVWLAIEMAGSHRSGVIAGVLAIGWLSSYCFSAALQPDGPHAFLVVMAIAATVHWRRYGRLRAAGLAGALFAAAQMLRPTLHPLLVILPLLLHKRGASRRYAIGSLLLWGTTAIVPLFVIGSNAVHHGVATPSHVMAVNLRCYTVPRIQAEQGLGSFHALRSSCLKRFQGTPPHVRIPQQIGEATSFLGNHLGAAVRSFAGELTHQLLEPIRLPDVPAHAHLYPRILATDLDVLAPFWGLALLDPFGSVGGIQRWSPSRSHCSRW